MKTTVLAGQNSSNGKMLRMMENKGLFSELWCYQVTGRPGKEPYSRKLEPKLKDATVMDAVKMADEIVACDDLSPEIKELIGEQKVIPMKEYVKSKTHALHGCPSVTIPIREDCLFDILDIANEIEMKGYSFYIGSSGQDWEEYLAMTRFRDGNAQMEICLTEADKPIDSYKKIREELLCFVRKYMCMSDYCAQMLRSYRRWKKNLHLINDEDCGDTILYLSCSRSSRTLSTKQREILEALEAGSEETLLLFPREELEQISAMCKWEEWKSQRFETLLKTGMARIENYDDMIVSFIGSRRCNMKCKYCFSDHTCEALSTLTDDEAVEITDMLTQGRAKLNLHIDNNLGGEPLMDFEAVKKRHNTMIAYQKTRGIRASFGLLTNGTQLGQEHLKWTRKHIPYMGVSLDGDKQTNDKIRTDAFGNGTYDRAVRGIKLIQQSNWPVDIGVSTVISRYNMDIASIQGHIRDELNVPNIVMKPVRAASDSDFSLTYDDLEQLKSGYLDFFAFLLEQGRQKNLKPLFTMLQPLDYAGRFFIRVFLSDRVIVKRCGSGEHIFSVADDASVYPCDSFNGIKAFEIANLQDGAHNRAGYKVPFVIEEKKEFGCQNCWARYLCGGICQYVQYLNNYVHNDVTKMECGLAKFLVESSIRFWIEAYDSWEADLMNQVKEQIRKIGFEPMDDRDAFVYAPC